MLKPKYIGHFDQLIDIVTATEDETGANRLVTWTTGIATPTYEDVNAMEVKASGSEESVDNQVVSSEKRAWVIRKFDRTITPRMAVYKDSKLYYITSIHPYGADRANIVLECEAMDND